jgi:hypothetical protein
MTRSSSASLSGTPPRAWGLPRSIRRHVARPRYTPTCVGTTSCIISSAVALPVHPHVRGDYWSPRPRRKRPGGTPPRAWGLLLRAWETANRAWYTPTCVGTTRSLSGPAGVGPVHPHVRGDYSFSHGRYRIGVGTPPRAWGLLVLPASVRVGTTDRRRYTPTCVGTTACRNRLAGTRTVHPHVRGDYTMIRRGKRGLEGSIVPFRLRDGQITHYSVVPGTAPFEAGRRLYQPEAGSSAGHRRVAPRRNGREPRTVAAGHPIGGRRWRSLLEGPLAGGERPDCPFRCRPDAAAMAGYPARSRCGATGCGPARAVLVVRVALVPVAPAACSRGMRRQTVVG